MKPYNCSQIISAIEEFLKPYNCANYRLAQSTGVIEYTDCTSAEGLDSLNEYPWWDIKLSDGEAPVTLELWGMQGIPSLPSPPGPLWLRVVGPERVQSIGQIELLEIHI